MLKACTLTALQIQNPPWPVFWISLFIENVVQVNYFNKLTQAYSKIFSYKDRDNACFFPPIPLKPRSYVRKTCKYKKDSFLRLRMRNPGSNHQFLRIDWEHLCHLIVVNRSRSIPSMGASKWWSFDSFLYTVTVYKCDLKVISILLEEIWKAQVLPDGKGGELLPAPFYLF